MQEGPDRTAITVSELRGIRQSELGDLIAGKLKETADLFCHAAAAARYAGHTGDLRACPTLRCAEARAILEEHARRVRERRVLV